MGTDEINIKTIRIKWLVLFLLITIVLFTIVRFFELKKQNDTVFIKHKIEKILKEKEKTLNAKVNPVIQKLAINDGDQYNLFKRFSNFKGDLIIYNGDTVKFWTDNRLCFPDTLIHNDFSELFYSYNNKKYLIKKISGKDYTVVLFESIPELENILSPKYDLVAANKCSHSDISIKINTDNKICIVRNNKESAANENHLIFELLFFVAYFLVLLIIAELYYSFIQTVKRKLLYYLFFLLDLAILFFVDGYLNFPAVVRESSFFINSFTFLGIDISPGNYLLFLISLLVAVFFSIRLLKKYHLKNVKTELIFVAVAQSFILLLIYFIDFYLKSCKRSLFFNLVSFTSEQITGYFIIALTGFITLLLVRITVMLLDRQTKLNNLIINTIVLMSIVFFSIVSGWEMEITGIYMLLYILLFVTFNYVSAYSVYFGNILSIVVLSVTAFLIINITAKEKEIENQQFVADYLIQHSDPLFEFKLKDKLEKILRDKRIDTILQTRENNINEESLKEYLQKTYFYNNRNYDFQLTWCRNNVMLELQPEGTLVPCTDYFETIPGETIKTDSCFEIKLAQSDFRTIYYIVTIESCKKDSVDNKIILEFVKEKFPAGVGYTGLLQSGGQEQLNLQDYSFALYDDDKLLYKFGDFLYPSVSKEIKNFKENNIFKWSGYYHIIKQINGSDKLIVSKKTTPFLISFFSFTIFFIFYLLALLIYLAIVSYSKIKDGRLLNYRNKIQLIYLFSFVSIFGILSGVSLYYINLGNQRTIINELEEKTHSVSAELQNKFFSNPEQLYNSNLVLTNLANYYFTDINLYDYNGALISTSRPAIFDKKLQSTFINPKAYAEIKFKHKLFYVEKEKIGNQQFYSAYMPLYWENGTLAAFVNLPYFAKVKNLIKNRNILIISFLNLLIILVIIILIISYYVTRMITKPLFILQKRLEKTNIEGEVETIVWNRDDEIGKLIGAYNNMVLKLKESTELLKKSERESAWREMARQIAHEIRNPLTPMKLSIQYLMKAKKENAPDFDEKLKSISETLISQIDALNNVAAMFSDFAKKKRSVNTSADLKEVISKAVLLFNAREHVTIKTLWDENETYFVNGDTEDYLRIFNNLIKNAVQALSGNRVGEITIEMEKKDGKVVIQVSDNGPGIDNQTMKKIFEPYFTTKSSGSGIGLAIVWNLVKELNGTITVQSERGSGTRFILTFPVSE